MHKSERTCIYVMRIPLFNYSNDRGIKAIIYKSLYFATNELVSERGHERFIVRVKIEVNLRNGYMKIEVHK